MTFTWVVGKLILCKGSGWNWLKIVSSDSLGVSGVAPSCSANRWMNANGKLDTSQYTRVYPKVPGLAAWSQNCKWYSSLPLDAVVSLFCESV
jgi:hypothetical protein